MDIVPKDSTTYTGSPVEFVDADHFAHVVGGGLRVGSASTGKAADFLFTDAARGVSCFGVSQRSRSIALAKRMKPPSIDVVTWPSKEVKCSASGGAELEFGAVALSRLGERLAGISHLVDHKLCVWDVPSSGPVVAGQAAPAAALVAEADLPVPCSMVAFNPADSTMLATASLDGGLFFWKLARSHGIWHLNFIEGDCQAMSAPALPGGEGGTDRSMSDDGAEDEVSLAEAAAVKTRIGAIAWGTGSEVYAGNADGVVGRFNTDTGALLGSYNQGLQNGLAPLRVVGLIFTKEYLVVATVGKLVYWLKCPEFDAVDHTATVFGITNGTPPENVAALAGSPSYTKFIVGTMEGTLHVHRIEPPAEATGIPDVMPTIGEYPNGFTLASTMINVAKSKEDIVAIGATDGSLRLFWAATSAPAATRVYRCEELPADEEFVVGDTAAPTSPANRSVSSNPASPQSGGSPKPVSPKSPKDGEGGGVGFNAPGMTIAVAGGLAADKPADPQSLPPVAITCLAALPGHPVLAVGLASGQLSIVYLHQEEKGLVTLPLDLKTLGREPLTHLAFSSPLGAAPALLAVVCAAEGRLYVIETTHNTANFDVVATVALPTGVRVTSVCWTEIDLLIVAGSDGSLATYAVPKPEDCGDVVAVASTPLQPLAHQSASSIAGQAAAASGGYSAVLAAAGGLFVCCPGNSGLVVNAPLPDKETMQSKFALADVGTMPPLSLKLKRTVVGHSKGISCAAVSSGGDLIATGGLDGLVVLWKLGKGGATRIAATQMHAAPVVSLNFARSDSCIVSLGLDRSSFISQLVNGKPFVSKKDTAIAFLATARKRAASGITLPVPARAVTKGDDDEQKQAEMTLDLNGPLPAIGAVPTFLERFAFATLGGSASAASLSVADAQHVSSKDLTKIIELKDRLQNLLGDNDRATDLERMERSEFVVDVARRDAAVANNEQEAEAVRKVVKDEDAVADLVSARIRARCVDSMEMPAMEVQAMQAAHSFVNNMPLVKLSSAEHEILEKCKRLRLMELKEMQLADVFDRGHPTSASDGVWPGRRDELSPNASWIINEGILTPVLDLVSGLKAADSAPVAGAEGGDTEGGTAAAGGAGGDEGDDMEDGSKKTKIDFNSILTYLYPPMALKTPNQKRMQIIFLNELVRELKTGFNKHFDKLHGGKMDEIEKIEEKNARIREILHDLQSSEDYFVPTRVASEMPESFLDVSEAEMSCKPYETEAMKKAKAVEEEEKARRDAEARKDNIGERALNDMMYGTLEVKKEGALEKKLEAMPEWMETLIAETYEGAAEAAVANMEPDQVKEYEEYESKKTAFEEAQRAATKALELELKRLKTEVADVAKVFDESVADLSRRRVQVQLAVCTQELYMLRVGLGLMESEDELVAKARLESALAKLLETKDDLDEQSARWMVQVDSMKGRLTELQDMDKALEKDFKKSVVEPAIEAVNQEQLKILSGLFKLRKTAASGPGSQGSRMSGSRASGRGSFRRSSVAQGSGRRSLADAAAGLMGARRSSRNTADRRSSESVGGIMGNLQKAMVEARDTAAAENDPFRDSDRKAEKAKALAEQMGASGGTQPQVTDVPSLDQDTDCPDGFRCEDAVWDKLNELRTMKIRSEKAVKAVQAQYTEMKRQSDAIQAKDAAIETEVADLQAQIGKLEAKLHLSDRNLEVMVKIKQGQNELLQESVVTDFSNGVLIHQSRVQDLNNEIKSLGAEKVRVLHKIKNFRKSINYMQWEENFMRAKQRDSEEFFTDLLLLRVEKKTLAIMKGEVGLSETDVAVRGEQRMALLKRVHSDKHAKISQANSKLSAAVRDRRTENDRLLGQLHELESSVKARESIYRSRVDGGDMSSQQKAQQRMKRVTMRRRLIDLARVQTEEIDFLRQELDRLRQRTFPSFAHAARHRLLLPPDEIV